MFIAFAGLLSSAATLPLAFALPASPNAVAGMSAAVLDGSADFDFLYGRPWHVHNRRLQQRMAGSSKWVEFDANDVFAALPGGIGSEEH